MSENPLHVLIDEDGFKDLIAGKILSLKTVDDHQVLVALADIGIDRIVAAVLDTAAVRRRPAETGARLPVGPDSSPIRPCSTGWRGNGWSVAPRRPHGAERSTHYRKNLRRQLSGPGQNRRTHSSHWRESAINQSIADPAAYREKSTGRIQARVGKAFAQPATEGLGKLTKS
jgi:hypothetical protein